MSRIPGLYPHGDDCDDLETQYHEDTLRYLTMQREMYDSWGIRRRNHIPRGRKMLNFFKTLIDDLREFKRLLTLDSHDGAAGHHGWDRKDES